MEFRLESASRERQEAVDAAHRASIPERSYATLETSACFPSRNSSSSRCVDRTAAGRLSRRQRVGAGPTGAGTGRVGPALRDAIVSGRMRAFLEKDRWE